MSDHAAPLSRAALDLAPRLPVLGALAATGFVAAAAAADTRIGFFLLFVSSAFAALCLVVAGCLLARRLQAHLMRRILSAAIETDPVAAFAATAEGRVLFANAAARERFDVEDDTTIVSVLKGLVADPIPLVRKMIGRADGTGGADEEVALRRGTLSLWVRVTGPDCLLWRLEDREASQERLGAKVSVGLPMLTASRRGKVTRVNEAMGRLLGREVSDISEVLVKPPLRSGEVNAIVTGNGSTDVLVYEVVRASGLREIYAMPAPAGPPSGGDWGFFDALPVAMLKLSPSGEVQMANRLARQLLAHRAPLGSPLSDLVEGLGRPVSEWLGDAAKGRGLNRSEVVRAVHPTKDVFLQITLGRVEDDDETALVAVLNDATELKSLEAQFVQSQKMQAIGQLAGGVAHDFNNLLTAISGHCDLMLLRHDETDSDYADLIQIHQNANRAASLVGQLLAFSRKQNLQLELLDIRDTLSELAHLLNRLVGEKVTLELDHGVDAKLVRADKRQIEQVMMNLVVNARDAMPEGGTIRITTSVERLEKSLSRDRVEVPPGEYVVLRVTDRGHGIPRETIGKIFEPFFSTKKVGEGTGLGLSTVYGIVKQTGGFIFADSEVGFGSTFTIYLRAEERPLPKPGGVAASKPPETVNHGEGVVLLVEDEAPVRAFASRALRLRGYTVLEADCAEAALRTLEDEALSVDVFVTDVVMPGMDGPSWVREALKARPDARVVFVSGYAEESLAESQARIPNSVFLPKPFSLNDLTATVQAQLS